jgi:HNH endonuclease
MGKISKKLKSEVVSRAMGCCEYCVSQASYSCTAFSIEHIIPIIKSGTTTIENLALACQGCNNYKYTHTTAIDPVTGIEVKLYNPRSDLWMQHFSWSEDLRNMVGISAKGRATIHKLKLNRNEVVNMREVLIKTGGHPPFWLYF